MPRVSTTLADGSAQPTREAPGSSDHPAHRAPRCWNCGAPARAPPAMNTQLDRPGAGRGSTANSSQRFDDRGPSSGPCFDGANPHPRVRACVGPLRTASPRWRVLRCSSAASRSERPPEEGNCSTRTARCGIRRFDTTTDTGEGNVHPRPRCSRGWLADGRQVLFAAAELATGPNMVVLKPIPRRIDPKGTVATPRPVFELMYVRGKGLSQCEPYIGGRGPRKPRELLPLLGKMCLSQFQKQKPRTSSCDPGEPILNLFYQSA